MRRIVAAIFYVLGGWILMTAAFLGMIDVGLGLGPQLAMMGIAASIALPFLLVALVVTPGSWPRELGVTLMTVAIIDVVCAVSIAAVMYDPAARRLLPPDMPDLRFNPFLGVATLAVLGAAGYALYKAVRPSAEVQGEESAI